jgi:HAD superfamily phosphoserine phosphatase-like hydrolase
VSDRANPTHRGLNGERRPLGRNWTAVVLAGSRPGADPLADRFRVPVKALVPVGGEPMVGRVVGTLLQCKRVTRVLVLTQAPDDLAWLAEHPRVEVTASRTDIAGSLAAVLGTDSAPWPALVTTADHPLLTSDMVEHFLEASAGSDATMGIVERGVMLARFPETKRTWIRFGGDAFTGANLFTFQTEQALKAIGLFGRAEADRKRRHRLIWHFGPALAFSAATRTVSVERGMARLSRRLGIRATAVALPFPEAGIDVDRLDDHELAERILADRAPRNGGGPEIAVSVFDLDRTLTRRATYTDFLLHAARRRAPWRLALAPVAALHFGAYRLGRISRKRLKERLQNLFLGARVAKSEIDALATDYARRLRRRGFFRQGLVQIAEEKSQGRRIVLATAANAFYADAIARELAVDELVCTQSVWEDDALTDRIEGPNCYGEDKLTLLRARLERPERPRSALHVRVFSDHRSDACVMHWADQAFAVNPERRFRAYADRMGWGVLSWL